MDSVKFAIGDIVYIKTDESQIPGMVTGIMFRPHGVMYFVSWPNAGECQHYGIELTKEKRLTTP